MDLNCAIEKYALSMFKTILVLNNVYFSSSKYHRKIEKLLYDFLIELHSLDIISSNQNQYIIKDKNLFTNSKIEQTKEDIKEEIKYQNKEEIEVIFSHNYFQILKARDEIEEILSSQLYPVPIEIEKIKKLDIYFDELQEIILFLLV
ncbi:MAG: hypothetical protein QNJ33_02090 [Crocosphaera sp.]|nr:hypothetical protein [Crocosphaera sp.]